MIEPTISFFIASAGLSLTIAICGATIIALKRINSDLDKRSAN